MFRILLIINIFNERNMIEYASLKKKKSLFDPLWSSSKVWIFSLAYFDPWLQCLSSENYASRIQGAQ